MYRKTQQILNPLSIVNKGHKLTNYQQFNNTAIVPYLLKFFPSTEWSVSYDSQFQFPK